MRYSIINYPPNFSYVVLQILSLFTFGPLIIMGGIQVFNWIITQ